MSTANTLDIRCECGQKLAAKMEHLGKSFKCPKCQRPVVVTHEPVSRIDEHIPVVPPKLSGSRKGSVIDPSTIVSAIAILLSVIAIVVSWRNTPRSKVANYAFNTPEKSLFSNLEIEQERDIWTRIELERIKNSRKIAEKLKTLKIHRGADYQGKRLLFVSFEQNGVEQKAVEALEKDAETGMWFVTYLSHYSIDDPKLKQSVSDWESE